MDKRNFLSNTSLSFNPGELSGILQRQDARALILSGLDVRTQPRLNDYFDLVIVDNKSQLDLLGLTQPDIIIHSATSLYTDGMFQFDYSAWKDIALMVVRHESLQQQASLGRKTGLSQLGYLSGGAVGTEPATVRGVKAGLAENLEGVHLATISGAAAIYDSAGRAGSISVTNASLTALLSQKDRYENPTILISRDRQVILEQM